MRYEQFCSQGSYVSRMTNASETNQPSPDFGRQADERAAKVGLFSTLAMLGALVVFMIAGGWSMILRLVDSITRAVAGGKIEGEPKGEFSATLFGQALASALPLLLIAVLLLVYMSRIIKTNRTDIIAYRKLQASSETLAS